MVFCLYLSIADWQIDLWIQWVSMDCESQNLCNGFSTKWALSFHILHHTNAVRGLPRTHWSIYAVQFIHTHIIYAQNILVKDFCDFWGGLNFELDAKTMECEKLYPTYILLPQNRVHGVSDGWFHICDVNYQTHFLKLIFLRSHRTIYRLFLIVYHFHRMWFWMVCDV